MRADVHLHVHILIETGKYRYQPIDGEAIQLGVADAREIGSGDSRHFPGFADGQVLIVENADDFGGEQGLELFGGGMGIAEVSEYIAATADNFQRLVIHCSISFNRFKRSCTRSN